MFMLWFWNSRLGRFLVALGGAISFVLFFYFKGRQDQKVKEALKEAEVIENARKVENEVDSLSSDDLRSRANRWVRK